MPGIIVLAVLGLACAYATVDYLKYHVRRKRQKAEIGWMASFVSAAVPPEGCSVTQTLAELFDAYESRDIAVAEVYMPDAAWKRLRSEFGRRSLGTPRHEDATASIWGADIFLTGDIEGGLLVLPDPCALEHYNS